MKSSLQQVLKGLRIYIRESNFSGAFVTEVINQANASCESGAALRYRRLDKPLT
jgi:hypothetical protein